MACVCLANIYSTKNQDCLPKGGGGGRIKNDGLHYGKTYLFAMVKLNLDTLVYLTYFFFLVPAEISLHDSSPFEC